MRMLNPRIIQTELRMEGLSKQLEQQLPNYQNAQADVVRGVCLAGEAQEGVEVAIIVVGRPFGVFGSRARGFARGHRSYREGVVVVEGSRGEVKGVPEAVLARLARRPSPFLPFSRHGHDQSKTTHDSVAFPGLYEFLQLFRLAR